MDSSAIVHGLRIWSEIMNIPIFTCLLKCVCKGLKPERTPNVHDMSNWANMQRNNPYGFWRYGTIRGAMENDNLQLFLYFANQQSNPGSLKWTIKCGALTILQWRSENAHGWRTGLVWAIKYGHDHIVDWYLTYPKPNWIARPGRLDTMPVTVRNFATVVKTSRRLGITPPDFRMFVCSGQCTSKMFLEANAICPIISWLRADDIRCILDNVDLLNTLKQYKYIDEDTILRALERYGTPESPAFSILNGNTLRQQHRAFIQLPNSACIIWWLQHDRVYKRFLIVNQDAIQRSPNAIEIVRTALNEGCTWCPSILDNLIQNLTCGELKEFLAKGYLPTGIAYDVCLNLSTDYMHLLAQYGCPSPGPLC